MTERGGAADDDAPTAAVTVTTDGAAREDRVAVEAPLELRLGGKPYTVLMRTPGADEELVRGFLFGEGVIATREEIVAITRPEGLSGDERGNVLAIELATPTADRPPPERLFYSSSSCGVCGKQSIAQLAVRAGTTRPSTFRIGSAAITALPDRLRAAQPIFAATGGVHAAGLFDASGALVRVAEDVGRHNAVDKLVGWALAKARLPLIDTGLVVSGRVSYEIMQKAIAAGIPLVAAIGAPSSLAIDLAEQFGVTLIGFLRAGSMNLYSGTL